jgi:hypothetical protein
MISSTGDIEWDVEVMGTMTTATINYESEWSGHRADDTNITILSVEIFGVEFPHDKLPSDIIDRAMREVMEYERSLFVDEAMAAYEARRDEDLIN